MMKSEWYIGTPNGVVLCINKVMGHQLVGHYYHKYSAEPVKFTSCDQLIFQLDQFFNDINFPYATTTERSFIDEKQPTGIKREGIMIMTDEEMLSRHGDLGTFVIRVQHRQNSSWQGRITWMEENKTVCFRSIWEMIKLMEGAVNTVAEADDEMEREITWFDEKNDASKQS